MTRQQLYKDRFKGNWPLLKSELQRNWQQFTDEDLAEVEGDYDKFISVVQRRCLEREEDVVRWANDWYSKREDQTLAIQFTISRKQM